LLGESGEGGDGAGLRPTKTALRISRGDREVPADEQPLHRAAHSGHAVSAFEGQIQRPDGTRVDVVMSATPMFDDQGKLRGGIAALLDITERRAAEAHQQVLLYELQHRVKNIITTIGALASRMMKDSDSLEDFSSAFLGRLRAMAATHELLSHGNWTGASLRALVEAALNSHLGKDGTRVELRGPDLTLTPGAASTLGLVFYELATNATKYGSLSAEGRIGVTWNVEGSDGDGRVVMEWVESEGPPVDGPIEPGFGANFVVRSIEYELNGTAEVQPDKAGLRWLLMFPMQRNAQQRPGH
jgi:two-component system CheB/CheR fusion protein